MICAICNKEINPEDNYCRITDYFKGKFHSESFFHTKCYNEQIEGKNPEQVKMKKAALMMLGKAQNLLNQVTGKKQEVYQLNE